MVEHDSEVGDWLWYEVFRRLPLKSVFKFKCVSKRWLSLISDPCMRRLYLSRADHMPVYTLLCRHLVLAPDLSFELVAHPKLESINFRLGFVPKDPQRIQLLHAHNGLLLSCESKRHYYVSDPLTARWAALPDPPAFLVDKPLSNWSLIVSVSDSNSRPLYKVIRIQEFGPERFLMDSFDSETMHWKSSSVPLSCPVEPQDYMQGPGVLYRGALHWIATYGHKIVAYDPAAHESRDGDYRCRVFDCPPSTSPVSERPSWVALGLSAGGKIRYVEHDTQFFFREPLFMSVWILKDYDCAEWCLEQKIHPQDVIYVGFDMVDPFYQIGRTFYGTYPHIFDPADMDMIYYTVGLPEADGLACYNISTATMKMVCTHHHALSAALFRFLPWPTSL